MSFGLVCQQCKEPLQVYTLFLHLFNVNNHGQIDGSLTDLAPSAYDMIVATLPSTPHKPSGRDLIDPPSESKAAWQRSKSPTLSNKPNSSLSPRAVGKQPQRAAPLPNESFVLLQDSIIKHIPSPTSSPSRPKKGTSKPQNNTPNEISVDQSLSRTVEQDHANPSPLSHHLRSTARLFNLLSTRTEIDHPLCAECTQILLTNLQRQLDETKKERDGYIAFEKEVRKERERESQGLTREDAEKKIEKLKLEEALVIEQIKEAEREREQLDSELHQLEMDEKGLEMEEAE
jgi:beclin 1